VGLKSGDKFQVKILNQKQKIASSQTSPSEVLEIKIPNAKLWTPEKPNLYDFELSIIRNGKAIDAVKGYFGMRKIAMMPDKNGVNRLFLNNKPVFQYEST
jgi:beta-galactosidase/beta-glucuronidase